MVSGVGLWLSYELHCQGCVDPIPPFEPLPKDKPDISDIVRVPAPPTLSEPVQKLLGLRPIVPEDTARSVPVHQLFVI